MSLVQPPTPATSAARRTLAFALLAAVATASGGAQPSPAAAGPRRAEPAVVTAGQFRALAWLAGSWRGRAADGSHFHERYTFTNDSTIEVRTFGGDTTFATTASVDSIMLRGGTVRYEGAVATRVEPRRIDFARAANAASGFTFVRTGSASWTATIRSPSRNVVYTMTRFTRAVAGGTAARSTVPAPAAADREAVRRAVLDYVEGFYEGDTAKLVRSVWPEVRKYGYARAAGGDYRGMAMPFPAGFMNYANGVRSGRTKTPPAAPKDIALLDVQDQTASAKLTAWWGTDYLLLARENGRWMITHVLWQSTPRPATP
jgi:hypothetical protein